jgi:serpin B
MCKISNPADRVLLDYNLSGETIFKELARQTGTGNFVFSPFSLGMAMDMAMAGACGETQEEMLRQLWHKPLTDIGVVNSNAEIQAYLSSATGNGVNFLSGNAMCVVDRKFISDSYRQLLKDKFSAEVFDSVQIASLNSWVSKKTNGMIPELMDSFPPNIVATILNAVYFKGSWESAFKKHGTTNMDFSSPEGQVKTNMMRLMDDFPYAENEHGQAVVLSYSNTRFAMVLGIPADQGRFSDSFITLMRNTSEFENESKVNLYVPKFKLEYKNSDFVGVYKGLGLSRPFGDDADFSYMTGIKDNGLVRIGGIVQKACIEVDEDGTTAAAATAINMTRKCCVMGPEPKVFMANKPFMFMIVDRFTGSMLFMGVVRNPTKQ